MFREVSGIMTIREIYDEYKHFDQILSDKQWLKLDDEDGSLVNQILFDLWQAIKQQALKECDHEWKEIYYGTKCIKCDLFYADGCTPWEVKNDHD